MRIMVLWMTVCVVLAFASPARAGSSCGAAEPKASEESAAPVVEKAAKAQATCPVMGEPINKSQYVDYQGKRVYFCCGACKEKFTANPDEYMKKLAAEGVEIEKAPE